MSNEEEGLYVGELEDGGRTKVTTNPNWMHPGCGRIHNQIIGAKACHHAKTGSWEPEELWRVRVAVARTESPEKHPHEGHCNSDCLRPDLYLQA